MAQWDLLITGAKVFDGEGVPGRIEDVAIAGGRVAARGADLPRDAAVRCVDAKAISFGATHVRVGSAIFGARVPAAHV